MNREYVLVKLDMDYADEFNVKGFHIEKRVDWEKTLAEIKPLNWEGLEVSFGSNEALTFESFRDFERSITVEYITKEEFDVITKLFKSYQKKTCFGTADALDVISKIWEREED